jgi:hypothetical protein
MPVACNEKRLEPHLSPGLYHQPTLPRDFRLTTCSAVDVSTRQNSIVGRAPSILTHSSSLSCLPPIRSLSVWEERRRGCSLLGIHAVLAMESCPVHEPSHGRLKSAVSSFLFASDFYRLGYHHSRILAAGCHPSRSEKWGSNIITGRTRKALSEECQQA